MLPDQRSFLLVSRAAAPAVLHWEKNRYNHYKHDPLEKQPDLTALVIFGDVPPESLKVEGAFNRERDASMIQAAKQYPDLDAEDGQPTAFNCTFWANVHKLESEGSPILHDPRWPEVVAHLCGAVLGIRPFANVSHAAFIRN